MERKFVPQMKQRTVEDLESDSNVVCKTVFGEKYYIAKEGIYFTVYDSEGFPLRESTNHLDVEFRGTQPVIIDRDRNDYYTIEGHWISGKPEASEKSYYFGDREEARI